MNDEFSAFQRGGIKSVASLNSFGEQLFVVHFASNFRRNYTLLFGKFSPLFFLMSILANDPQKQAKTDTLVLRYRMYTRRIRRMLHFGGILQERKRSIIWSYITGLLMFMCLSHCIFMLNFCRDNADNLMLFAKVFGMTSSFIAPVIMVCYLLCSCAIPVNNSQRGYISNYTTHIAYNNYIVT